MGASEQKSKKGFFLLGFAGACTRHEFRIRAKPTPNSEEVKVEVEAWFAPCFTDKLVWFVLDGITVEM